MLVQTTSHTKSNVEPQAWHGDAVVRLRHWLDWDGVLEYFGNNEHAARKVITDVEQMIDGGTIWYLVVIAVFLNCAK